MDADEALFEAALPADEADLDAAPETDEADLEAVSVAEVAARLKLETEAEPRLERDETDDEAG